MEARPKGPPTMTNVYKELMAEANRQLAYTRDASDVRCR